MTRRQLLVLGDSVLLAGLTLVALRLGASRSDWDWTPSLIASHLAWFPVLSGLWLGLAWAAGLYDPARVPDRWTVFLRSAQVSLQLLVVWAVVYFIPPPWTLVRHVALFFAVMAAVAMPLWRQAYAELAAQPAFRRRVLIVGAGGAGRALVSALAAEPTRAWSVAGFVDDDPALAGTSVAGVPIVATSAELVAAARRLGAHEVVLAVTRSISGELFAALMDAREQGLAVTPMPVLYEAATGRVPVEHVGDHWQVALPLDASESRGLYGLVRRGVDITAGLVGLAGLIALWPVAALAVKAGSRGPIFYSQVRVGRAGRHFRLWKLRTMVADAEADGPAWSPLGDPRVTWTGRWLRRLRLDELPQAWNILRGDMSLIGPRPERPEFVDSLAAGIPFYRARHAVRPGLTGWASIQQGYTSSHEETLVKLQYDLYYIKHQSFFLDAYILMRTAACVLGLKGR